jgi:hypothetical protein
MIISKEAFESFLKVKDLIKKPQLKYSNEQFLLLSEVYAEITKKPLTKGCAGCLETGLKILKNWMNLFEDATKLAYDTQEVIKKVRKPRKPKA